MNTRISKAQTEISLNERFTGLMNSNKPPPPYSPETSSEVPTKSPISTFPYPGIVVYQNLTTNQQVIENSEWQCVQNKKETSFQKFSNRKLELLASKEISKRRWSDKVDQMCFTEQKHTSGKVMLTARLVETRSVEWLTRPKMDVFTEVNDLIVSSRRNRCYRTVGEMVGTGICAIGKGTSIMIRSKQEKETQAVLRQQIKNDCKVWEHSFPKYDKMKNDVNTKDLSDGAYSHVDTCPKCDGACQNILTTTTNSCYTCRGSGKVYYFLRITQTFTVRKTVNYFGNSEFRRFCTPIQDALWTKGEGLKTVKYENLTSGNFQDFQRNVITTFGSELISFIGDEFSCEELTEIETTEPHDYNPSARNSRYSMNENSRTCRISTCLKELDVCKATYLFEKSVGLFKWRKTGQAEAEMFVFGKDQAVELPNYFGRSFLDKITQ